LGSGEGYDDAGEEKGPEHEGKPFSEPGHAVDGGPRSPEEKGGGQGEEEVERLGELHYVGLADWPVSAEILQNPFVVVTKCFVDPG
jgi:hypothetical protein